MHSPGKLTEGLGRQGLLGIVALACLVSCESRDVEPVSFVRSQDISFGILDLRVTGWEVVPASHAPIVSLSAPPGEKAIVVFIRWKGLDQYADFDRRTFVRSFLSHRTRIIDGDGFEYRAISAMPRELYHFTEPASLAPREWAVVFHVWVDSAHYTVLLEHPEPANGGFRVAAIILS